VAQRIPVKFQGADSGIEDLTWAQWAHWNNAILSGVTETAGGMMALAPGMTVGDIVRLLGYLMNRHQALRTKIIVDAEGNPRQQVLGEGEIDLEVVDADDTADPAVIAEALRVVLEYAKWDFAGEWPVRMAVVRQNGLATHLVAMYSNLCIDGYGIDALVEDLSNMDPLTGQALAPVPGTPPLEQARTQRSPAGQRQSRASLRHWERILRSIEPRRFGQSTDVREPRYWECSLRSPAMTLALQVLSGRSKVHSGTIMLAAYAVAIARISGQPQPLVRTIVSNRFRPGFAASVSNLALGGLCVVDVADCTFDEAIERAFKSQLTVGMHSYYDPREMWKINERVSRERGAEIDLMVLYNDRRRGLAAAMPDGPAPTREEVLAVLPESTFEWTRSWDSYDCTSYLTLNNVPGPLECIMHADTHAISPAELEAACRGLETLIVGAAFDPQTLTGVSAV
jgi:hypothetical protein